MKKLIFSAFAVLYLHAQMQPLPQLDTRFEQSEALYRLNAIREAIGLNGFVSNDMLQEAALRHARYIVNNDEASHYESSYKPYFSGETPLKRALAVGYQSRMVLENLSTRNDGAADSIDGLMSAIYHRFAFLDPTVDEVGIGIAQDEHTPIRTNAFVYMMGNSALEALCRQESYKGGGSYLFGFCKDKNKRAKRKKYLQAKNSNARFNPEIIVYPYDEQDDVYPAFYEEIPDPLPDMEVSGFPVSVTFNPFFFNSVKDVRISLYEGNKPIEGRFMDKQSDPNAKFTDYQYAFFPLQRLKYDTQYQARMCYRFKNETQCIRWSFHTRKPDEPLFRISQKEQTLKRGDKRFFWLYFVPRNEHDTLGKVTYDKKLSVRFIDNHTLRVVVPDTDKSYTLKAGERTVRIVP
jgi:uncharacterized protein YkwD